MLHLFAQLQPDVTAPNIHRGVVLWAARVVVLLVPTGATLFYLLIVRRKR